MADQHDERRLLRWIGENGGAAGTVNVAGRGGEIGVDANALSELLDALEERELIEIQDDGDAHLTALGRAMLESADS